VSIARESSQTAQGVGAAVGSHFFAGTTHGEALFRLEHLVENDCRCGVVAGPSGTGKSTVLAVFVEECRRAGLEAVAIDVTGLSSLELLERLARQLGVTSQAHGRAVVLWTEVTDALVGCGLAGQGCVVVVDHLDRAKNDCRQLVRRLATRGNMHQGENWILSFSGRLFPAVPREWRERSDLRIELGPLSDGESHDFLESLCDFFNRPRDAFAVTADSLIHVTRGVLGDLRRLAERSLLLEGGADPRVSPAAVAAAVEELRGLRFSA
jgi:general secretion pathway protein A